MKPDSVKKFDLFFLASIAIAVVSALMNWDQSLAGAQEALSQSGMEGQAETFLIIGLAFGIGLGLLLWAMASPLRLGFARWLLLLFVAYRAVSIPLALTSGMGSLSITGLVTVLLEAIALWFLFRPDAKQWYATRGD